MRNSILITAIALLLLGCSAKLNAQGTAINSTGASADNSAMLDVSSTTKGTLITRMTTVQRNAIASPAEGLLIFNTSAKCFESYVNGAWYALSCPAACIAPAAPTAATHTPLQTQITWNWNTVSGAVGYKWNTANDYGTATDNGSDTSYSQTGLNCGTAYSFYVWAYNVCGNSNATTLTQTTSVCGAIPCTWNGLNTYYVTHTAGAVAPVSKNVTYGQTQTSISGASKCWITQNLGSDNQASSATDATEPSAGWYWQFNRKQGFKHDGVTRTPNTAWIYPISENSDWQTSDDPCTIELGSGWRIPTYTEWFNANANGAWTDYNLTYASVLKLHAAGYLFFTDGSSLTFRGGHGYYWSSTQFASGNSGWDLRFFPVGCGTNNDDKASGFPLRCLKD